MDDKPFTAVDRDLLKRCLAREPGSWNDFVDRFLSLIYHTIGYTAHARSVRVGPEDVEDIAAEVLLQIVAADFKVLREFRKDSSLATYLTVIARRICVHELVRRQKVRDAIKRGDSRLAEAEPDDTPVAQKRVWRAWRKSRNCSAGCGARTARLSASTTWKAAARTKRSVPKSTFR